MPPTLVELPTVERLLSGLCAVVETGEVYCWGYTLGGLGDLYDLCDPISVLEPQLQGATEIAIETFHGCALVGRDAVRCWGNNNRGQLGDGTTTSRPEGVLTAEVLDAENDDSPPLLDVLHRRLASAPVKGYALLWNNMTLYSAPEKGARIARLDDFEDEQRFDPYYGRFAVKVLADHGDYVTVETLGRDDPVVRCALSRSRLSRRVDGFHSVTGGYRLRWSVPRTDLAPLLTREVEHAFDDGSLIKTAAGVGVIPRDSGTAVLLGKTAIRVPLSESDVGLSYTGEGLARPRRFTHEILEQRAMFHLGETSFTGMLLDRYLSVTGMASIDDVLFVDFWDECLSLTLRSENTDPFVRGGVGIGGLGGRGRARRYRIAEGARAYWRSGHDAGVTRREMFFGSEPETIGERRCFEIVEGISVCHDADDVSPVQE